MAVTAAGLWPGGLSVWCQHMQKKGTKTAAVCCSPSARLAAMNWSAAGCSCTCSRPKARKLNWHERRRCSAMAAGNAGPSTASANPFADLMQAIQAQLQGNSLDGDPPLADVDVQNLCYHPAGTAPCWHIWNASKCWTSYHAWCRLGKCANQPMQGTQCIFEGTMLHKHMDAEGVGMLVRRHSGATAHRRQPACASKAAGPRVWAQRGWQDHALAAHSRAHAADQRPHCSSGTGR